MTRIMDIMEAIERVAPRCFQEEYDNSGLQVGFPSREVDKVLVCLDITEEIIDEAASVGAGMIVSHHPLLFRPLSCVSDRTYQQRCVTKALSRDIALYSAHTSLDNAKGGVNHKIAEVIGLSDVEFLCPSEDPRKGGGVIGTLEISKPGLLAKLKADFNVESLRHSAIDDRPVRKIALCGGSGAFMMGAAKAAGADCFISGEFHYHDYFENDGMMLVELGHYQSEQYSCELLGDIIKAAFPQLEVRLTSINTNPIRYGE